MRRDSGSTDSVWPTLRGEPTDGVLEENKAVDVCVVGAGVVGLSVAYRLMKDGHSVVILDDGPIAGGETARTTAHLVSAIDDRYFEIERLHGAKGAKLAAESHQAAIDLTGEIVTNEGISCQWSRLDGYLFAASPRDRDILGKEYDAARKAGVAGVEWAERAPMPGLHTGRALLFAEQATLEPLTYLRSLVRVLRKGGVAIHTYTHGSDLKRGSPHRVTTGNGSVVRAKHVVEATNAPVFDHYSLYLKQAPYRTYAFAAPIPVGDATQALFWDTADPYHYVRLWRPKKRNHEFLIVGGEDHPTGDKADADAIHQRLEAWAKKRFPSMEAPTHRWSGQVWEPVDSLAFIGRTGLSSSHYVVTGDSGNGWTHAAIASQLVTDMVAGRENPWEALYSPLRKSPKAIGAFAKETAHVVKKLGRLVKPGDVDSEIQIAPGSGAILRKGLRVIAAYRDEEGVVHERSAICRHMGCVVAWNSAETTWDCPCHGSRFDRFGTVINGPANEDLKPVGESESEKRSDGVRRPRKASTARKHWRRRSLAKRIASTRRPE